MGKFGGVGSSTVLTDLQVDGTTVTVDATNNRLGLGTAAPGTQVQVEGSAPYITLKNDTAENTDGGCESRIIFEDHANVTLAQIQGSHDGSSDDTKGDLIFSTHDGSSLDEALRIDSAQLATFAAAATVTTNLTVGGDIILDDGGSLKEAGGTAAITFDGSGNVTKLNLAAAAVAVADDHIVILDGGATGAPKAESIQDLLTAIAGSGISVSGNQLVADGGGTADSVAADNISAGDAAVTIKTSSGAINIGHADNDEAINIGSGGTGAIQVGHSTTTSVTVDAVAVVVDSADTIDIDAADEITIDTTSADGHIAITSAHTAGDSILISANANAGSILDIDAGILDIDVQAGTTLNTTGLTITDTTTSSATEGGSIRLVSNDGAAMADDHRLGVIEFAGAEDASNTITVGAKIEAICDAGWSASENGTALVMSTTDANASQSEVLRLDSDKLATFAGAALFSGNATFGADDTGVDVRIFSATASEGVLYDASEDELALLLTTKLKFHDVGGGEEIFASSDGHLEINAGTTLDITAPTVDINASTALTIDGSLTVSATDAQTTNGIIGQFNGVDGSGPEVNRLAVNCSSANQDTGISFMDNGSTKWTLGNDGSTDDFHIRVGYGLYGVTDEFILNSAGKMTLLNDTASSATQGAAIRLVCDDGAVMADNHRLGVIEFAGAEDTSNTVSVGARIQAICRDAWDGSNNDADLEFYTTDGTTESLVLTLDADKLATFASSVAITTDLDVDGTANLDNTDIDGTLTMDGSSFSLDSTDNSNITMTANAAGAKTLTIAAANSHGSGAGNLDIDADGAIDIDAAATVSIDSTAGSITLGAALADGQTLKLGKNGAVETIIAPHGTAGSEAYSVINTSGDTDGAYGQGAMLFEATAGGIGIKWADGKDLWAEGGRAIITANEDAAQCIKLHADAGTSQTILVQNDAGTTDGAEAEGAILIEAAAGGIGLHGADDKKIWTEAGEVIVTANNNGAAAIKLHADAGANQTIQLLNDAGTGAAAIDLTSTAGGITMTSSATTAQDAVTITASQTTKNALTVTADSVTTAAAIDITADALTSGSGLKVVSNSSSTTVRSIASVHQDHSSATHAVGLRIIQDSVAPAIQLGGSRILHTNSTVSDNSSGQTITATQVIDGTYFALNRGGSQTDTTATAAQLVAAVPNAATTSMFHFRYINMSGNSITLAGDTGVTMVNTSAASFTVPAGTGRHFLLSFGNVGSGTEAVTMIPISAAFNTTS